MIKNALRLLNAGAEVNAIDKGGFSVLMVAASQHNPEMLRLLIKQGAALNVQDSGSGWNALIWAVKEGLDENVAILVTAGADHCIMDASGKTALHWAKENKHQNIAALLTMQCS